LNTRLPATLAALERGEIDLIEARAVVPIHSPMSRRWQCRIGFWAGPASRPPASCGSS
jgi:hypothetical protein